MCAHEYDYVPVPPREEPGDGVAADLDVEVAAQPSLQKRAWHVLHQNAPKDFKRCRVTCPHHDQYNSNGLVGVGFTGAPPTLYPSHGWMPRPGDI